MAEYKTKFSKGDEVLVLRNGKLTKDKVNGVSVTDNKNLSYVSYTLEGDSYTHIEEKNVYKSKEDFVKSVGLNDDTNNI